MHELTTIAEAVDALTNPMQVRERYDLWDGNNNRKIRWHQHTMPSLIDQLERAAIPGEVYLEDNGGGNRRLPASCPPARLEAINLSLTIQAWAADQAWKARTKVRDDTAGNLRALVGAQIDSDTVKQILDDLRRWVYQARVIAGWQRPAWRPDAPCPACERRGLRVRLDLSTAACVECQETWDPTTIGILAEYVRGLTASTVDNAAP